MSKIKLNKKYRPLLYDRTRYNIIYGGRGSSKSFGVTTYLILKMLEQGNVILFTRYTMTSAHISIIPEFVNKIELLGLESLFEITKTEITCLTSGSKIMFRGIKTGGGIQTASLKSIADVNLWVCDEAEEIVSEEIFDTIDLSIRTKTKFNKVILIFNPTTKESWIYQKFFEDKGVEPGLNVINDDTTYIFTSYQDNLKHLEQSFLKQIEKMKIKNPKKYNHVIMGGFLDKAEGVIFSNWGIGEFNDELEFGFGADFGFSKDENTLVKVAIDRKNELIYLDEKLYTPGLVTSELYDIYKLECSNKLIVADNAEGRLIEEIKRKGVNIKPCTKGAGSVAEGVTLMQNYRLIVTKTSINLIKELNNYIWNDRKSGTPIDMYNHLIDAARYYISDQLKKPKVSKFRIR